MQTTQTFRTTTDPYQDRFGTIYRLPRGLREEAQAMTWGLFIATYSPQADIRITSLESEALRMGKFRYTAEVTRFSKTLPPQISTSETIASGPIEAISHALNEHGRFVEIVSFHQHQIYEATVTFLKARHQRDHRRTAWAVGFGPSSEASSAHAMAAAAQRIYG